MNEDLPIYVVSARKPPRPVISSPNFIRVDTSIAARFYAGSANSQEDCAFKPLFHIS